MERVRRNGPFCRLLLAIAIAAVAGTTEAASHSCLVKDVMVHGNRVHVQCLTPTAYGSSTIRYFAVPLTNTTRADRLMTIGTTALVAGRRFTAVFSGEDITGAAFGCAVADCRYPTSFGIE